VEDLRRELKRHTPARVGLSRTGVSLKSSDWLAFKLDHAEAVDAVRSPFDPHKIRAELEKGGVPAVVVSSQARDKEEFLLRPDLGRRLSEEARVILSERARAFSGTAPDVMFVICDGHSSMAMHRTSADFILKFFEKARWDPKDLPPCCIAERGRVALADEAADIFKARLVINLIGERPGLRTPDSMGIYMTYGAFPGIQEGLRNCISNVRPGGLSPDDAVRRLSYLVESALSRNLTGTALKDDMPGNYLPFAEGRLFIE
jgi:ethanolamine ammonia-lyase small subunit